LGALSNEVDERLGICGTMTACKNAIQTSAGSGALILDRFQEVLWSLLWAVQNDFCQALPAEHRFLRCCQHPADEYIFGQTLGHGGFGVVKLAEHRTTGAKRAVKIIKKDGVLNDLEDIQLEVGRLSMLDHPHIVRLYGHFQAKDHAYLVMDYCSSGDLHSILRQCRDVQRQLSEKFIANVMQQLLLAIAHVHTRGIIHLDVKCGNVMLTPCRELRPCEQVAWGCPPAGMEEQVHVMLIDFGVAQVFRPGNFKSKKPKGTPSTMAPEVWRGEIHPKADVFSCGVVLFQQLTFTKPFEVIDDIPSAIKYWNSKPEVPWFRMPRASRQAVDFCRSMLLFQRGCRPTAAQCLRASFLSPPRLPQLQLPLELAQHFEGVPKQSLLYKSVALSIARTFPANQLPKVKRLFLELDTESTGKLGKTQVTTGLEKLGLEEAIAHETAEFMDMSRDGVVCWTEFVASCLNLGSGFYDHDLERLFKTVDGDSDGLLSRQDLSKLLLADQLRESNAVCDIFVDLVGRQDDGARIDWHTFRKHFETGVTGRCCVATGAQQPTTEIPSRSPGTHSILEQASAFVDGMRDLLWPDQKQPEQPSEEDLQKLAEMGFTDCEKCKAALQRNWNLLPLVIEELCREDSGSHEVRNGL